MSSLPRLKDTAFKILQIQNVSSKLTPKHAGFVHTVLFDHEVNSLLYYNCPPPKFLLGVQLAGQRGTIPCVLT